MGVALTWLAGAFALLPSLLAGEGLAALDGRSRLALALVPWLLLAGVPRRASWRAGSALGLAALTLSLAAWLDAQAGMAAGVLAQRALWGLGCGSLAWAAATRARGTALHGALWFCAWLVVPGLGGLAAALAAGAAPEASGLALALGAPSRALASAAGPALSGADAIAFASSLLLLAAGEFGARRRPTVRNRRL